MDLRRIFQISPGSCDVPAMFSSLTFRIRRGPLAGARWLFGGGGKLVRLWRGSYEPEQTRLFCERVGRGAVVFDVGAHAGYYTLLGSRRVGPEGRVVAFEAFPENAARLRAHVALEGGENVTVVEAAVAGEAGRRHFRAGTGSGTGALAGRDDPRSFEVEAIALDGFCDMHGLYPQVMKIDVEGAEAEVLRGAARLLANHRPTLFLSLHGAQAREACLEILGAHGYGFTPILGASVARSDELLCEAS